MAAVTTGREVATGTLWISKADADKVRIRVAARCGTPDCTYHGQLNIYEESSLTGGTTNISEPSRVISLSHINEVSSLNTSHPTFLSGFSPPKDNSIMFPMNEDIYPTHEALWGFMLLLQSGEAVELFADTREQQQLWIKYLHLMSMFPSSPIPEEPRINPIRDSFRSKVKLSNFDADSVWPVYILSEEVGSRIQALGVHVVTLQSTLSSAKPARMTVISPLDNEPIVTWEANKMRRTGSLGNLVFIEIGRRCEGGPGLIWMYAAPEDSLSFRETVTRFLFNGDARPVVNNTSLPGGGGADPTYQYDRVNTSSTAPTVSITTPTSINSSPSSSGGSSFRLSYSLPVETPKKNKAEYDSAEVEEEDPAVYDYAFTGPDGPFGSSHKKSSTLPHPSSNPNPPPVNLGTHPSRHKVHRRTFSGGMGSKRELLSELSTGQLGNKYGGSNDSGVATISTVSDETCSHIGGLEADFLEIDKSLNDIMSDLSGSSSNKLITDDPPNGGLDDIIASLEELAKDDIIISNTNNKPPPFVRSNTLPHGMYPPQAHRRTNSTSTCHPVHYLEQRRAKAELQGHSDYVTMKATSPLIKQKTTPLITTTSSNQQRLSYDGSIELSPIKENTCNTTVTTTVEQGEGGREYENYPRPDDIVKGTPITYTTPYENITSSGDPVFTGTDDDIYENNEPLFDSVLPSRPSPLASKVIQKEQEDSSSTGFDSLISSTLNELDNLQNVLELFGK